MFCEKYNIIFIMLQIVRAIISKVNQFWQPCEGVVSRAVRPPDRRSVKHAAKQGEQQHCRSNHPYRRRSERVAHQSVHRPHHEQQRQCAENEMQYDHRIGEQAAALPFLIERFDFLFIHMYVSF